MVLSTTGLQEGDFTLLRVLKNNVMQDMLSLTASGSPDIAQGSLNIGHTAGLQTQLTAKATTAALSAAVDSLGAEIDTGDTSVSAVTANALGSAVASLGDAVGLKASQVDLTSLASATQAGFTAVNTNAGALGTLVNDGYSTLEASIATRAARGDLLATNAALEATTASTQTSLDSLTLAVSGKQGLIGDTLFAGGTQHQREFRRGHSAA